MGIRPAVLACAPWLLPGALCATEPPWIEVKSPHFVAVTNAGEKTGRRLAWQFEQVRGVVARLWPWAQLESGKQVVILAARDEATLKSLAPEYWERKGYRPTAVFVTGRDRHYAAIRSDVRDADALGLNPYLTAYQAYLFLAMDQAFPPTTPVWFERGVVQVLANSLVRDDVVEVGRPIAWKLDEVRKGGRLRIADLIGVDRSSAYYSDETRSRLFDAEAWAFVHLLMYGDERKHAPKLQRFVDLVRQGRPGDDAFREAFGDPASWDAPFDNYVSWTVFPFGKVAVELSVSPEGFSVRTLTAAEAAAIRAGMHVAMNRPAEARALADEARRDPTLSLPFEVDGLLLDRDGQREQARAAFASAAEKGSRNFYVYYRLAQLEWQPNADRNLVEQRAARLRQALELNPDSADTHSFLADTLAALDQAEEGLRLARRAVALEPRDAYHRLALSRVLWRMRRADEAAREAQTALGLSGSDAQRKDAREQLDFLAKVPVATPPQATGTGTESVPDAATQAACFQSGVAAACEKIAPSLERRCAEGSASACGGLGWLLQSGRGVAKDGRRAEELYGLACDAGERRACVERASIQAGGDAPSKGLAELEALCETDLIVACTRLAVVHAARQTPKDLARARALLETACAAKDADGCRLLQSLPK